MLAAASHGKACHIRRLFHSKKAMTRSAITSKAANTATPAISPVLLGVLPVEVEVVPVDWATVPVV